MMKKDKEHDKMAETNDQTTPGRVKQSKIKKEKRNSIIINISFNSLSTFFITF